MIRVQNVYKSFANNDVLKDISFVFETKKTNLIIGQSGSGKTVLLKSIIGLHSIDHGDIIYDNRSWKSMNAKQQRDLRKEIGMLFQGSALFDSMTVAENVGFPMMMFSKSSKKEMDNRVAECLDRVNLGDSKDLYPSEISGGMQKRVAIARAIVMKPSYLFCDEPNSGLDPKTSIIIDKLIHEITIENNMTTIINTHDMNSVMEIGDNILFIEKGTVGWEGNKEQILHSDNEHLNSFVFASKLYKKIKDTKS